MPTKSGRREAGPWSFVGVKLLPETLLPSGSESVKADIFPWPSCWILFESSVYVEGMRILGLSTVTYDIHNGSGLYSGLKRPNYDEKNVSGHSATKPGFLRKSKKPHQCLTSAHAPHEIRSGTWSKPGAFSCVTEVIRTRSRLQLIASTRVHSKPINLNDPKEYRPTSGILFRMGQGSNKQHLSI